MERYDNLFRCNEPHSICLSFHNRMAVCLLFICPVSVVVFLFLFSISVCSMQYALHLGTYSFITFVSWSLLFACIILPFLFCCLCTQYPANMNDFIRTNFMRNADMVKSNLVQRKASIGIQCRDQKFMFLNVFMLSLLMHAMAFSSYISFFFFVPYSTRHSTFNPIDSTAPN